MRILCCCLCFLCFPTLLFAEEALEMAPVVITGKKLIIPTRQTNEVVYTGSEITRSGIEQSGGKTAGSVYEALSILPGVSVDYADPFGLAAEQRSIRIRGVRGMMGSLTVEGIPNYGGNPMGPRDYLYDMENFDAVAVYKGATPADLGTGVGARGGAIELRPLWPRKDSGAHLSMAFGAHAYRRAYARFDTGAFWTGKTALSVSASHTDGQKWKGPGDLGPRTNLNVMLTQLYHDQDSIKLWMNHNQLEQNLYKSLSYEEAKNIKSTYRRDYTSSKTGIRKRDIDYYQYNRGNYENTDFLAVIPWTFCKGAKLTLKPYYSAEYSKIYGGTPARGGLVQKRIRDIKRYGLNSQFDVQWGTLKMALGYFVESQDMDISAAKYHPVSMKFLGYGMKMKKDDNGLVQTPYLTFAGEHGPVRWQAGLKYFWFNEPKSTGYLSKGPDFTLIKAPDLGRDENTYKTWLPSFGASYDITDELQVRATYGRTHIRPYAYMPLINVYQQNRKKFQQAGISLADMFDGYDMEKTDTYELGLRYQTSWCDVAPTIFYAQHKNLLTTVYDPRVDLSYYQNVAKATGYGVELEANFFLTDDLTIFFNPTYTHLTYNDDLSFQGQKRDTAGKQVVDTPAWIAKTGLVYRWNNFTVSPSIRYVGKRYGDAEHKERVDEYLTADLSLAYTTEEVSFARSLRVGLDVYNLFDTRYVSMIKASDDGRQGRASYYAGAPFSALLSMKLVF